MAPGGSLCLLSGSSGEAGKEKINSGCLDFLARPERGDLPGSFPYMARLLWAGILAPLLSVLLHKKFSFSVPQLLLLV